MKSLSRRTALAAMLTSLAATVSAAEPFVMKLSSPVVGDASNEWMQRFKAGVEARAPGRIRIELYPSNQLGQIPATIEGVVMGTIEGTLPAVGFLVGLEPRFQVLDIPGLFDSVAHGQRVLADPEIRALVGAFGASKGVEALYVSVASPSMLVTARATTTLANLKGQKIRAPGGSALYQAPLRALGANPIAMPLGEVLSAMQNHTIDGTVSGLAPFVNYKYYDLSKNMTELPGSFLVATALVNRAFMKSLGPELEQIVREESRKAEAVFTTWQPDDLTRLRDAWQANGGRIYSFSPVERQQYLRLVADAVRPLIAANPQIERDHETFKAAAKRHRQ